MRAQEWGPPVPQCVAELTVETDLSTESIEWLIEKQGWIDRFDRHTFKDIAVPGNQHLDSLSEALGFLIVYLLGGEFSPTWKSVSSYPLYLKGSSLS